MYIIYIYIHIIYYVYIDVETLSHRGTISWLKPLPTARRHQLRDIATWDPADPRAKSRNILVTVNINVNINVNMEPI